ncbi:hypothetical protein MENTO_v1c06420 [Mesoplasma entomophilum]|uniref:Uncharacterized protein n=1 Tax=Mesoplasma entomophilum TaxID=2149 RepID=A0A3S5XZS2_9MOLU|nr:hypothetical protein [Mesoplasma entomophilum]ATQ35774.1 hypothetical protein CS528_03365 [Mesoplasma entomophilum]ATZ19743.1 hypothetical protein MENTO_v1c06420 [Mesoplasma entomophilum]
MLVETEQQLNSDIIVETITSNNMQSFLAPEIAFFNKPYVVNKNSYYKMLVSLNLNPNIANTEQYEQIYNIQNLDFKLFTSDLKEIKPSSVIPKSHIINNQNKIFFVYEIPLSLKQEHSINLNFGLSHDFNSLNYKSKGTISLNSKFAKVDNKINLNLVNYLTYYDNKSKQKKWTSECLVEANVDLKFPKFEVNKQYSELGKINIEYIDKNKDIINFNQILIDEIQQIKNNKIFPAVKLSEFKFNNEKDFKNFYSGELKPKLIESQESINLVYLENSFLDEKNKKVLLDKGEVGLFLNPFNWNKNQNIQVTLEIFGENIDIILPIKSYSDFKFIDSIKFEIQEGKNFIYRFTNEFWSILTLLTADEIKEVVKEYEIT